MPCGLTCACNLSLSLTLCGIQHTHGLLSKTLYPDLGVCPPRAPPPRQPTLVMSSVFPVILRKFKSTCTCLRVSSCSHRLRSKHTSLQLAFLTPFWAILDSSPEQAPAALLTVALSTVWLSLTSPSAPAWTSRPFQFSAVINSVASNDVVDSPFCTPAKSRQWACWVRAMEGCLFFFPSGICLLSRYLKVHRGTVGFK